MSILDLIFPKNCLECKKGGNYVCESCVAKVRSPKPTCPRCDKPSIDGFTHIKCKTKNGLDGLTSIWNYEGVIRKAIIALKYKYAREIVEVLNYYIVKELKFGSTLVPNNYSLVPVSMHWYRENSRGFNQSSESGKALAKAMGWRFVPDLLVRSKITTPQAQLKGKDRRANIKGVFSVNPSACSLVPNTSIILFDDVYTTGSTLKEAAKVLKRAGANKVWGLTMAS